MTRYLISFHVRVEVDAIDPTDAIHKVNLACDWPGDYSPPLDRLRHRRLRADGTWLEAEVVRSQALMVKEAP